MKEHQTRVAAAWAELNAALAAQREFVVACKHRERVQAAVDPRVLERVARDVAWAVSNTLGSTWNTQTLAQYIARLMSSVSAKTLQNVYLPALRDTSPHCVKSGRQWLWYKDAARSRDTTREGAE